MSCLCKREKMAHFTSCHLSPWISAVFSLIQASLVVHSCLYLSICSFFCCVLLLLYLCHLICFDVFLCAIYLWHHKKWRSNLEALCATSGCCCAHARHWRAGRKTHCWVDFLRTVWVYCYFVVASFTFLLDKWYKVVLLGDCILPFLPVAKVLT